MDLARSNRDSSCDIYQLNHPPLMLDLYIQPMMQYNHMATSPLGMPLGEGYFDHPCVRPSLQFESFQSPFTVDQRDRSTSIALATNIPQRIRIESAIPQL
ncbi:hypothetical protein PV325_012418 [Microctonus aethiopoides]|nr:hypothetical protein PV325_012418 [Microctonus aethiopoides]